LDAEDAEVRVIILYPSNPPVAEGDRQYKSGKSLYFSTQRNSKRFGKEINTFSKLFNGYGARGC